MSIESLVLLLLRCEYKYFGSILAMSVRVWVQLAIVVGLSVFSQRILFAAFFPLLHQKHRKDRPRSCTFYKMEKQEHPTYTICERCALWKCNLSAAFFRFDLIPRCCCPSPVPFCRLSAITIRFHFCFTFQSFLFPSIIFACAFECSSSNFPVRFLVVFAHFLFNFVFNVQASSVCLGGCLVKWAQEKKKNLRKV